MKADYPLRFINSVTNEFQKGKDHGDESFTFPPDWFGITKPSLSTETPYCELNEIKSNHFLGNFTNSLLESCRMIQS